MNGDTLTFEEAQAPDTSTFEELQEPESLTFEEAQSAPVIRDVDPGSLQVHHLLPAIRKMGGELAIGEQGDTHPDIISRDNIPATDIDQRGFAGPNGEFYDRETAAKGLQIPTQFEPGRLHSTDLAKAQEAPPKFPSLKISPYEQAEIAAGHKVETGMEPGTELTTAIGTGLVQAAALVPPTIQTLADIPSYLAREHARRAGHYSDMPLVGEERAEQAAGFGAAMQKPFVSLDLLKAKVEEDDPKWAAAIKEAENLIIGIPEFIESPLGLATAGIGATGKVGGALVRYAFTADMLKNLFQQYPQMRDNWGSMNPAEKGKALAQFFGTATMIGLLTHPEAKANVKEFPNFDASMRETKLAPDVIRLREGGAPIMGLEPNPIPGELSGLAGGAFSSQFVPAEQPQLQEFPRRAPAPTTAPLPVSAPRPVVTGDILTTRLGAEPGRLPSPTVPARAPVEAKPAPAKTAIEDFTEALEEPGFQRAKTDKYKVGLSVKSINDLEALAQLRDKYSVPEEGPRTPEKAMLGMQRAAQGQLAREAIESAISFGSQDELTSVKKLGERPLDWRKNPEVAKWIVDNAERMGWEKNPSLPEVVASLEKKAPTPIRAGPTEAFDYSPEDLAKYQELKSKLATFPKTLEAIQSPEYTATMREYENLRNKYNGNPPKQLVGKPSAPTAPKPVEAAPVQAVGSPKVETFPRTRRFLRRLSDIGKTLQTVKPGDRIEYIDPDGRIVESNFVRFEERDTPDGITSFAILKDAATGREYGVESEVFAEHHLQPMTKQFEGIRESLESSIRMSERPGDYQNLELAKTYRDRLKALQSRIIDVESTPELVGMGGARAGEVAPGAQIEQLTQALQNVRESRAPLGQQIREAFAIGDRLAAAKDTIGRAVSGLKATGDLLIKKWQGVPNIDDLLRAKKTLSKAIESRGWRLQQWEKAAYRAVPNPRDQAAIAKWVDAGGDTATLQRGLAEAPAKYKRAYQDALNLSGDKLTAAQNVQNYFESRLQEAIDAGVLDHGVENYLHRIYENKPALLKRALAYTQTGLLNKNPALAKKRFFQFDWEAEKEGFTPVQSFIKRITAYEASLSKAIAAREFIKSASEMKAADGRPVVDIKGVGIPVEDQAGAREGTLIKPKFNPAKNNEPTLPNGNANPNYRGDYVNRDYRALSRWKWVGEDAGGKPIFVQGDVAIHPDYVSRVDALLKPSQVRFGKFGKVLRPALGVSSTIKQTMLDLSAFHPVQITVHGLEHRVLPWKIVRDIDLSHPDVDGLLQGGVTLGGDYSGIHREGLVGASLTRKIPWLGPVMESYHQWLFQSYIPRIKMTMALHALERNRARYAGKLTEEQIFHKTASEANAAFGELNYTVLERSKTAQDMARLILLAPDFLEARGRFAAQALTRGGKMFGNEQRTALLLGALTMWVTARIANKMVDDQYHFEPENLFNIVYKGHAYGLRTVQGDLLHLLTKPMQFTMSRLNPVYARTLLEALTGRDYFGRKRSPAEQVWDVASTTIPISLRSNRERSLWESMANAFGVTARRYSDVDDAFKLAQKWKDTHAVPERGEFIYDPNKDVLRPLKLALNHGDEAGAAIEIKKLVDSKVYTTKKLDEYFKRFASMPFTGSKANDKKFFKSLTEDQRKTVEAAREHRKEINRLYHKSRRQMSAPAETTQIQVRY